MVHRFSWKVIFLLKVKLSKELIVVPKEREVVLETVVLQQASSSMGRVIVDQVPQVQFSAKL